MPLRFIGFHNALLKGQSLVAPKGRCIVHLTLLLLSANPSSPSFLGPARLVERLQKEAQLRQLQSGRAAGLLQRPAKLRGGSGDTLNAPAQP